ncbi:RmlC-like cupin domain-containing protein [Mycena rosella]|uniref:RmlC-like cupin domain-containing protein n=1 Tax=Mycena rosella TaxID=1033263 RepID=A0AAD7D0D8_MYCRO|nr:RmlC-like cupin domain-containing protein [Mycena rosella]
MSSALSVPNTLSSFTDLWSPRLVASVNDQHVKIAKIDGAFIWHSHPDSDELFYLLAGKLTLELEDADAQMSKVVMQVGDVFTVPKGMKHRPVAEHAHIMMIEKAGTVNTGDAGTSELTRVPEDVRPRGE